MTAVLRGRVLDAAGRPVAGAQVAIASAPVAVPDIAQLTGEDGSFALAAPAPGTYTVGVAGPGAESSQIEFEVGDGDPAPAEVNLSGGTG